MNLSFLKKVFGRKLKIGLVLGAGGARGFAHVGVLKALEENSIKPFCITGTSAGALIGGLYSTGMTPDEMQSIINDLTKSKLAKLFLPSIKSGGLVDGERIKKLIEPYCKNLLIENLPIKFCAVTADLISGNEVVFSEGDLVSAIRASISIPGIFTPVQMGNRLLVDGGVLNPLPIDLAYKMGANYIIAVNAIRSKEHMNKPLDEEIKTESPRMLGVILSSLSMIQRRLIEEQLGRIKVNILIKPEMKLDVLDFHKGLEAIEAGYKTAKQALSI